MFAAAVIVIVSARLGPSKSDRDEGDEDGDETEEKEQEDLGDETVAEESDVRSGTRFNVECALAAADTVGSAAILIDEGCSEFKGATVDALLSCSSCSSLLSRFSSSSSSSSSLFSSSDLIAVVGSFTVVVAVVAVVRTTTGCSASGSRSSWRRWASISVFQIPKNSATRRDWAMNGPSAKSWRRYRLSSSFR